MDGRLQDEEGSRIGNLLLDLARAHHWTGLYPPGHPVLSGRFEGLREALSEAAGLLPSRVLVFGIAWDRILYGDRFFGDGNPLVAAFTEVLSLRHVATLGIAESVTAGELSIFFRCLHDLRSGKTDVPPEEFLERKGVRGIRLSPIDYKEVLSRGTMSRNAPPPSGSRQEPLWRALLSEEIFPGVAERKLMEEFAEFPDPLRHVMKHAMASAMHGAMLPSGAGAGPGVASPAVLRRMFRRIGLALKALPESRRVDLLGLLVEKDASRDGGPGVPVPEASLAAARSLVEGYSDREFLELSASLLAMEAGEGKRLLRIFEILAAERGMQGSLLPLLRTWRQENLREKKYFAGKTWETIERVLAWGTNPQSEGKGRAAHPVSPAGSAPGKGHAGRPGPDPAFTAAFSGEAVFRKGVAVHAELLLTEKRDADFQDLLASLEKVVPRLIDGNDFPTLDRVLSSFRHASESGAPARRAAAAAALASVDFPRIVDAVLASTTLREEGGGDAAFLLRYGSVSADALLQKLRDEETAGRRKILLSLIRRLGEEAVPSILARMEGSHWFFQRNLCFLLGEIGAAAGIPALTGMLSSRERKVRQEAIRALGKIGSPDPGAIEALGKILLDEPFFSSSREDSVRMDAAVALSRIGSTEAVACLHFGTSSRRKAVRERCEVLLGARGAG